MNSDSSETELPKTPNFSSSAEVFKPEDFEGANDCHDSIMVAGSLKITAYSSKRAAEIANRLLTERAVRMMAHAGPSTRDLEAAVWIAKPWQDADSTHSALLVAIEPLKAESAEDLLREFLANPDFARGELRERARALLGNKADER